MTSKLPLVDPTKVLCPVLMLRGDHDGISTNKDLWISTTSSPMAIASSSSCPRSRNSITNAKNRAMAFHMMHAFLTIPPQGFSCVSRKRPSPNR
jgi:hypothetical protein